MKASVNTSLAIVATVALGLSLVPVPSVAAGPAGFTYYACRGGTHVSKISVRAHSCPRGSKAISGSFAGANFTKADFTGAKMATARLTGARSGGIVGHPSGLPTGWKLLHGFLVGPGANLSGANLASLNLSGADLTGANLQGTSFYSTNLSHANLTAANLASASLSYANITGTRFANALMKGVISSYEVGQPAALPANWQVVDGSYEGRTVAYLVGPGASIGGAQLKGLTLTNLNLSGIYMAGSTLVGTSLAGSTLTNATLASSNLQTVDFTGVNATGANFSNADFEGANLTNANFTNVNLSGSRLLSVSGSATAIFTGAVCPDGAVYNSPGANC